MRRSTRVMTVVCLLVGCSGEGPALPGWLFDETMSGDSSTGDQTTVVEASTSEGGTTVSTSEESEASTTTGAVAECGNGDVEVGEDCDGTDWNGATCESLGFSETGLMCVGCQFDVSGCGPPPGMVEVPGGMFEMGSTDYPDEMPTRQVQVDTFWMDETEVTVEAYAACVDVGECSEPSTDTYCNWMVAGREDHPVNCVTWYKAEKYCGFAGEGTKRLPTEAEWEKAARGTDTREYPWGDSPAPSCTHAVMDDAAAGGSGCGMGSTWAVGSKPMGDSPYGAHDMAGNVGEWVADWYASPYDATETDNPTGPAMGTARALRGGSWANVSFTSSFRAARRADGPPFGASNSVGFRCARTPPAPL
jgi:sulfatase modifying factor 1